jgi:hypothetical protein
MMRQMMEKMCGAGACSPAMCQGAPNPTGKTGASDSSTSTVPSSASCCSDGPCVEDEVLAALKARGPLDLATLVSVLEITPESALDAIRKLVTEGKATLGSIRATDATP